MKRGSYHEPTEPPADGLAWFKSEGSIRMGEGLGWPWAVARIGRLLPSPFRNSGYEMLAANRLRFFGRREMRFVPTPDIAARFLR
jgi:predicted DCC family thiol-disulfide oxidoreductase YuxK